MSQIVVNNNGEAEYVSISGIGSGLVRKTRSFAYFQFQNNTVNTALTQNVWEQFANPTGGLVKVLDNASDFEVVSGQLGIRYIGTTPKIFNLSAVTNIFKVTGSNTTRTVQLQWRLNGTPIGFYREVQADTDSNIYTGNGMILLSPNDVLTPWVQNIENNDDVLLNNASFTMSQEITHYYE